MSVANENVGFLSHIGFKGQSFVRANEMTRRIQVNPGQFLHFHPILTTIEPSGIIGFDVTRIQPTLHFFQSIRTNLLTF